MNISATVWSPNLVRTSTDLLFDHAGYGVISYFRSPLIHDPHRRWRTVWRDIEQSYLTYLINIMVMATFYSSSQWAWRYNGCHICEHAKCLTIVTSMILLSLISLCCSCIALSDSHNQPSLTKVKTCCSHRLLRVYRCGRRQASTEFPAMHCICS